MDNNLLYVAFTNRVIYYELSKYLSYIELLSLSYAIPETKILLPSFKQKIHNRLKQLDLKVDEFIFNLKQCKGVISGSFLIQILLSSSKNNVIWQDSDIDIFFEMSKNEIHCHCDDKFAFPSGKTSIFSPYLCENGKIYETCESYDTIENLSSSRKWQLGKSIINDIVISGDIKTFINQTFDFDFCKILFDGDKLTILKPFSLLKRKCSVIFPQYFVNKINGSTKSNFDIRNVALYPSKTKTMFFEHYKWVMTLFRKEKYEKRDFKVELNQKINMPKQITINNNFSLNCSIILP